MLGTEVCSVTHGEQCYTSVPGSLCYVEPVLIVLWSGFHAFHVSETQWKPTKL